MRLLHTADWHLGRVLHAHALLEDQAHVLDQLVAVVRDRRPDAVLIAGDVFDRAVPPPEAVGLLDDVLSRIVIDLGVPVVMIAGNHDSADRLGFGARLMATGGLRVAGRVGAEVETLVLGDEHGEVAIHALPYGEPAVVRDAFRVDVHDHEAAMKIRLEPLRAGGTRRTVLVAHAFVTGGLDSASERPLSIGGTGAIGAELFSGFDYVALGHLHRPQTLKSTIRYAGSLLKYSLSEVDHDKSVTLVELGAPGDLRLETITLSPRRDFRVVEGSLAELVAVGIGDPRNEDYVYARLTDADALLEPMAKLRVAYPNALDFRSVAHERGAVDARRAARLERTPTELFAEFFAEVTGEALSTEQAAQLGTVLSRMQDEERRG